MQEDKITNNIKSFFITSVHQYLNLIFYKLCMQEYIKKSKTKITIKVLNIVLKKIDIGLNKISIKLLSFTKISPQYLHFNA